MSPEPPGVAEAMQRARQMDASMAAGLTLFEMNLLAHARGLWQQRNTAGETYPIWLVVEGMRPEDTERRLDEILARPAAMVFDEVFVAALRRERAGGRRPGR